MVTTDIIDALYKKEHNADMDDLCNKFNNSTKIKFIFLRCQKNSSWECDTVNLWGPDIEAEYIVDILTKDGTIDTIEFLSLPRDFDMSKINKTDILAYSSNVYSSDYILNIIDKWHPKVLLHLSDEFRQKYEYTTAFNKVKLVYRQYKLDNEDTSRVKHLPVGYHSWGKYYIRNRQDIIPINNRKYIWCFSGSSKGDREKMLTELSDIKPSFNQSTKAFETTPMFKNSKFAFSPQGNSTTENSRIYEAMYNGTIPIIVGDKNKMDEFKNMFELPLPCYFVENIQGMKDIINNTSVEELIKVQNECIDWCYNISDIIRENIINCIMKEDNVTKENYELKKSNINILLIFLGILALILFIIFCLKYFKIII